ncbi:hypothetical protein COO91_10316 (plasmid) [Nostoc flagelliforme CCNUN1]|uniref:Uncharacterized protein n=2 Tax=Nostoc flagelliforme TaxID=1306274 RepID=A0A2K8T8S3_9NOSO|nr:hypothetical protein COO91_10316 [Nostoc flagelliforme CCNUN1]
MLKGLGINLSGSRIKYLLGEVKKNTRRRHKKESSDSKSTTSESILSVTQPTQLSTASESINSVADSKPATSAICKRKNQQLFPAATTGGTIKLLSLFQGMKILAFSVENFTALVTEGIFRWSVDAHA